MVNNNTFSFVYAEGPESLKEVWRRPSNLLLRMSKAEREIRGRPLGHPGPCKVRVGGLLVGFCFMFLGRAWEASEALGRRGGCWEAHKGPKDSCKAPPSPCPYGARGRPACGGPVLLFFWPGSNLKKISQPRPKLRPLGLGWTSTGPESTPPGTWPPGCGKAGWTDLRHRCRRA